MYATQDSPLDIPELVRDLEEKAGSRGGAVVTFTGRVRDYNNQGTVEAIFLESYPAMTDKALAELEREAMERWPELIHVSIIHRIGMIEATIPIVFVGVVSPHRDVAFQAASFIMDTLKMTVPLWKKELTPAGWKWVDAKQSDKTLAERWSK